MDFRDLIIGTKSRIKKIQDLMYLSIIDYVVKEIDVKNDKVVFSQSNIAAINRIDKATDKLLGPELRRFKKYILKGITSILSEVQTEFKEIDVRAIEISDEVNKKITKHATTRIDQITSATPIFEEVKAKTIELMQKYEGISLQELREQLSATVKDKKIVQKYWSRWTYDIYNQYERIGANEVRKRLGLSFAVYEGGEIETTRPVCEKRNRKVFHISEIESWVNDNWEGKNEIGYKPIIDLGGYNCRHRLRWITKETAAILRPEIRTLFAFEFSNNQVGIEGSIANLSNIPKDTKEVINPIEVIKKPIPEIKFNSDKRFDDYINTENVPDLIKNVVNKLPKPTEIKSKGRSKGSYYSPSTNTLVSRIESGKDTFFHEYGHHVDMHKMKNNSVSENKTGANSRSIGIKDSFSKDTKLINEKYGTDSLGKLKEFLKEKGGLAI
jgi:hypothetical protein